MSEPITLPADLINLSAAGRLLGVAPCTIYRWMVEGKLRAWRAGRRWRVRRGDVLALIEVSTPRPEVQAREARALELAEVDRILREAGVRR